jgi:protein SCO1/2
MNRPRTATERLSWLVLLVAMVAMGVVFVRSELRGRTPRGGTGAAPPLRLERPVGDFRLTNQFGIPVDRQALEGFVWVADVIFSRCPGQCHQLSLQMREVQRRLPPGAGVRLVSLTADPEFDTPEVLAKYGRRYGYDTNNWLFLTGPKADVYRLATQGLLFSVVEQPPGARASLEDLFIHSTAFALVDRRGRLRGVVQGELTNAVDLILQQAQRLTREP